MGGVVKNQSKKIQKFVLENIANYPHDIVSKVMSKFDVSRTTVLRHIQHLVNQNKVIKTGTTRQITYALNQSLNQQLTFKLDSKFDEYAIFTKYVSNQIKKILNKNSYAICEYVITEILNNCMDHSMGSKAVLSFKFANDKFYCNIEDDGKGAFYTLASYTALTDIRDVIFELSKGKLTCDPQNHTGEGIFFSSKAVDYFKLCANRYEFIRDNIEHDWTLLKSNSCSQGTLVSFEIDINSKRQLETLFQEYTDEFTFNKTDILINLSKLHGERLISRSQAKRVCRRLEEFNHITLDFKHVVAVGQGFIDQLFRVYQQSRPELDINYINANEDIVYMIKRCLATSQQ